MSANRIALAFCPKFKPGADFVFPQAAAEFSTDHGKWMKLGNPSSIYPPRGTFYVRLEFIPALFAFRHAAAWALKDQGPTYRAKGLGARYGAVSEHQCPTELIRISVSSKDQSALRELLIDEGVDDVKGLGDREYLLEFADGRLAGPVRLWNSAEKPRKFFCSERTLSRPLGAWPGRSTLAPNLLTLGFAASERVFVATEHFPDPFDYLDYASPQDILHELELGGGTGGSYPMMPSPTLGRLSSVLEPFLHNMTGKEREARERRLEELLERAATSPKNFKESEHVLLEHPAFRQALTAFVARPTKDPVAVAGPPSLVEENQAEKVPPMPSAASLTDPKPVQVQESDREPPALVPVRQAPVHSTDGAVANSSAVPPDGPGSVPTEGGLAASRIAGNTLPLPTILEEATPDARPLATVAEALDLLTKNLQAIGLARLSAISLARESVVGASLGQVLFFTGSLAAPVAEIVAATLAGRRRVRISIPVGLVTPLSVPGTRPEDGSTVLILEGMNRSCLSAYGDELKRLLLDRALGLRDIHPNLLVIGTLLDGASVIAPAPEFLAYGPVLATDYYTWRPAGTTPTVVRAFCHPTAWKVEGVASDVEGFQDLLDELSSVPNVLWEHNVSTAGRRLLNVSTRPGTQLNSGETAQDATRASLLFGWVLPFLISQGASLSDYADRIRGEFSSLRDQRLIRFLKAHHVEVSQ